MRTRWFSLWLVFIPLWLMSTLPAHAVGQLIVTLRATRSVILADGKQTTDIIAEVRDENGRPVGSNTFVNFTTTAGTLAETRVLTLGGVARTRLTSAPIAGIAKVTAFASGGIGGANDLTIVFADDPAATFQGNNYMLITGKSYLAYSATDRAVEAEGKNGGARIVYQNIDLTADRLQLRCDDSIVRAHGNIVLKRAGKEVKANRLYYSLTTGQGYAVSEVNEKLQTVTISGEHLVVTPSPTPIPTSYVMFPELQVKLVIVARSITYFPGDKLQFRRPKFYQDQVPFLSLPYYELSLHSQELFSDQFVSVGTSGFGLELPFYLTLSPRAMTILYLRHQQQLGRGYYATTPGWAIDLVQGYTGNGAQRSEGAYGFTGLTRSDWSFRWTHNQEFTPNSQGSFYLDFPHHDSVFSTTNFSQQTRKIRWGTNLTAGQAFRGAREMSLQSDAFVETQPHRFSLFPGMLYTMGATINTVNFTAGLGDSAVKAAETTKEVSTRLFSRPQPINSRTTFTNSFTMGHLWSSSGRQGVTALATLALDHTLRGGGGLNLTYDFVERPSSLLFASGKHRVSMTYSFATGKRLEASLFGSSYLDTTDASLLADVGYRFDKNWRFLTALTMQKFSGESYRDLEFTIGRRIGAREVQLTYSTLLKRLSIDFTATRF